MCSGSASPRISHSFTSAPSARHSQTHLGGGQRHFSGKAEQHALCPARAAVLGLHWGPPVPLPGAALAQTRPGSCKHRKKEAVWYKWGAFTNSCRGTEQLFFSSLINAIYYLCWRALLKEKVSIVAYIVQIKQKSACICMGPISVGGNRHAFHDILQPWVPGEVSFFVCLKLEEILDQVHTRRQIWLL